MLVIHHNDADGWCSAAIVCYNYAIADRAAPGASSVDQIRLQELDYGKPFVMASVQPDEEVVIVDCSLTEPQMAELLKVTKNVIWIDHHASAQKYRYASDIKGLRCFEPKVSAACELTWTHYHVCGYLPEAKPRAVKLIGDYDKWAMREGKDSKFFHEAIRCMDRDPKSDQWPILFGEAGQPTANEIVDRMIATGAALLVYRDNLVADYCDRYGGEVQFYGQTCWAVNLHYFGSPTFGPLRLQQYPICITYARAIDPQRWVVGLYSEHPLIDVGQIASQYGTDRPGGGHNGAAGFTVDKLPFEV